MHFTSSLT